MPTNPPPTTWELPDPQTAGDSDLVGVGADLLPGTILAAYRQGLFPMPIADDVLGWWSPAMRGIIPLDGLKVSRSLRRSMVRFEVRINTAFEEVVLQCAHSPSRPNQHGDWITDDIAQAYLELHRLGWAHSFEAWSRNDGQLVGGLYGIAIGGLFAGESMFHHETDASKVALVELIRQLVEGGAALLDVQWLTEHLASLGAIEVSRSEYMRLLNYALALPLPKVFAEVTS